MTRLKQLGGLVAWLLVVYAAAAVGSAASIGAPDFYTDLERPPWAPPPWLFGPVWTVLYGLMGVAAWLVWLRRGLREAPGLWVVFFAQLVANALWTWLFFAWRLGAAAFAEIVVLWLLILATLLLFWRVHALAGLLLLPYLLWVGFAAALTYAVWQANPAVLG